ncbi:MAG TPA: LysM peptidoglycan-binding domain-containing protein [Anaerolineales bacterium]|jgi:murein DD-endopeptidase MepM/ murein hydrolase activator NlpD
MPKFTAIFLILAVLLSSCTRSAPLKIENTPESVATLENPGLPTGVPVQTFLPPTRMPGEVISSPTPNGEVAAFPTFTAIPENATLQTGPTATPGPQSYTVQAGDFPSLIAEKFGISTDELLAANKLGRDAVIFPGDTLIIPISSTPSASATDGSAPRAVSSSDYFKILPDSELVYGPLSSLLDVNAYIQKAGGYLAFYTDDINGETLTGTQILMKVAQNYSVNPRVLLAMLEYRAQWVTNANPAPSTTYNPIGYVDDFHQGLYRQLTWTANMLNEGFYRWKEGRVQSWTLVDGTQVVAQPGINPGTAAIQHVFASLDTQDTWAIDTGPNGLYATYNKMFGYPFDFAIEPLLPAGLTQPVLSLPFQAGELWQFTGGPHAGWDSGSAWAALDFAPPGEPLGCAPSEAWTTAVAPGMIVRASDGAVVEDLDGDGLEQTGWTILYMHMESRYRVQPGTIVQTGDRIGHPSCEGGLANADHLHLARRYNGLWIPAADPQLPFVLDNYVTTGNEVEYDGWLTGNGKVVEAWDGSNMINQIQR